VVEPFADRVAKFNALQVAHATSPLAIGIGGIASAIALAAAGPIAAVIVGVVAFMAAVPVIETSLRRIAQ
jgi:hypothetical protein